MAREFTDIRTEIGRLAHQEDDIRRLLAYPSHHAARHERPGGTPETDGPHEEIE